MQTWHNRRLAKRQQPSLIKDTAVVQVDNVTATAKQPTNNRTASSSSPAVPPQSPIPSLCFVLQSSWEKAVADLRRPKNSSSNSGTRHETTVTTNNNNNIHRKKSSTRQFPSVLPIRQANALLKHVEHFHHDTNNNDSDSAALRTGDSPNTAPPWTNDSQQLVLSVLPAGYNWNQAVWQMTQERSRAFLLLDLAALVHTLVAWQAHYCRSSTGNSSWAGGRSGGSRISSYSKAQPYSTNTTAPTADIHFLYQVQSNADQKLLQLLSRSRVGLVATTKWDVDRCLAAQASESSSLPLQARALVWDNCAVTGKPDGYLRKLLAVAPRFSSETSTAVTVAVDGPDDVERVWKSVQRIQARRSVTRIIQNDSQQQQQQLQLDYMLRLDGPVEGYSERLKSTLAAVRAIRDTNQCQQEQQCCLLVGFSLDVTVPGNGETIHLQALQALDELLDNVMMDTAEHAGMAPTLRIDLTGLATAPFPDELVSWWSLLAQRAAVRQVTIDVTRMLVSPAGALCTRIIGVKREETASGTIRRHYYIDDGCYGSLYQGLGQTDSSFLPLPLFSNPPLASDNDTATASSTSTSDSVHLSTVWGPTCDGLDRVCRDIPLPNLQRDDWLVFPNLGCSSGEGLGTAFNGFDPPDTAYCVLGYFRK